MPTNEIKPFGINGTVGDGDVLALADYNIDPDRLAGNQAGIARRDLVNTVLRQVSHMTAGLAQFIANRYVDGVLDDGDLDAVEAGLVAAIVAAMGDIRTQVNIWTRPQRYTTPALEVVDSVATWDMSVVAVAELVLPDDSDVTLVITNAQPGTSPVLRVTQGAGEHALIYPATILWAGGTAHEMSTAAAALDVVQFDVTSTGQVLGQAVTGYAEVM